MSVTGRSRRSNPLRVVGRNTGKHALPRGSAQPTRDTAHQDKPHRPKHAATMPRLTDDDGKKAVA
jgi:hypothetical protein